MLKNKSKIFALVIAFMIFVSTISFATDDVMPISETNENEPVATSEEEHSHDQEQVSEDDIYSGDLYLFDNNVVMDKLVDGNVFIMGQNVEITGKVNGSLYVLGNKVTVSEESYIVHSLYVCANELQLKGAANDLYAACNKIDMPYNSFIIRDLRVAAESFNFAGGVGRDAFVEANQFTFEKDGEKPAIIYGNLNYSASSELELSKELVNGDINYNKFETNSREKSISEMIVDKIIELCKTLIYTAVVFLLILWLAPNFTKKASSFIGKETVKCFGIGLLGFIASIVGSIILLCTRVGVPVAISAFTLFALMMAISFAITAICISYKIKEKYDLKTNSYAVTLILVTIALWALELIPVVGGIVTIIVSLFGFGTIILYLFIKNKKEENKESK